MHRLKSKTAGSELHFASFSTRYCFTWKSSQPKLMGAIVEHTSPNKHQIKWNNLALL